MAKDLDMFPQVFRLRAEEDIIKNCPEKEKINVKQLLRVFCILGNSGVSIFGQTVTNHLVPLCQVLRGDVYWPKGTGDLMVVVRTLLRFKGTGLID